MSGVITPRSPQLRNAVIPASGTTSEAIDLYTLTPCGIYIPATMTGSSLSFTASDRIDGTYYAVKDDTNVAYSVAIPTSGGAYIILNPRLFAGVSCLKIVSASSEGAARTIGLSMRGIS